MLKTIGLICSNIRKSTVLGPCFLNTFSESELSQLKAWGEDVNLDCESAATEELAERMTYTWNFHPLNSMEPPSPVPASPPHLDGSVLSSSATSAGQPDPSFSPFYPGERESRAPRMTATKKDSLMDLSLTEKVARFTGSTFRIRKITLAHAGEYRCSVHVDAKLGDPPGSLTIGKLSRTFRVRVQRKYLKYENTYYLLYGN